MTCYIGQFWLRLFGSHDMFLERKCDLSEIYGISFVRVNTFSENHDPFQKDMTFVTNRGVSGDGGDGRKRAEKLPKVYVFSSSFL
jgi:hypothetical protein